MLDKKIKKEIRNSLVEEKKIFFESTIELFNKSINDIPYQPMLYGYLGREYPTMFDEEHAKKVIEETFEDDKNPIFDDHSFHFKLIGVESINDDRDSLFYNKYLQIQNKSFDAFWDIETNIKNYHELGNFDCFLDLTLSKEESEKYLKNNSYQVFNYNGWLDFFKSLHSFAYQDYIFDKKKSDSKLRFLKKINDDLSFGFEYDLKELKYRMKNGILVMPDVDIIIITDQFEKNAKYLNLTNSTIWSLCPLEHPFFYLKASLAHLYGKYTLVKTSENSYARSNLAIKEPLSNGLVRIYNIEKMGEHLKKFCFYEVILTSSYKKSFLNYIEQSIIKTFVK